MEIKTLKDLKKALEKIPDEVLINFGAGISEAEFAELLCNNGGDEAEMVGYFMKMSKKYPNLDIINKWIKNLSKITLKMQDDDELLEEFISSEDKI